MSDDLKNRGPRDRAQVNEDSELRYWSKEFGCTAAQLRKAVEAVGTSAAKVRAYLKK